MGIRNKTITTELKAGQEFYVVYREVDMPGQEGVHINAYSYPVFTHVWRAGEYGIDPEDIEHLMDAITYELEPAYPKPLDYVPPLLRGKSIADCRAIYQDEVAQTKDLHEATGKCSGAKCPVRKHIRDNHVVDGKLIEMARSSAKQGWVQHHSFSEIRASRLPATIPGMPFGGRVR